ncbi:hypothetical protein [Petroclostridium sp. X23]|nr:hypothetical protein [Petroclostridium sp. X23]WHH57765.1 hypothetical protein QKW49_18355 [Petroclostridium sp. X23]
MPPQTDDFPVTEHESARLINVKTGIWDLEPDLEINQWADFRV